MKTTAVALIGSGPAGLMREAMLHDPKRGYISKATARKIYFREGPDA